MAYAEPKVLVTTKPIHALVAQVMGDTGTPELLVSGSASPHTFIIKPSDARKLAAADIVFRVSESIEPFTAKAATTMPKTSLLVTLQQAPGVATLPQRSGGAFEIHEHSNSTVQDDDHDHAAIDGHIWLDPANAKAMIDQIAKSLTTRAPALAATYEANASAAKARIDKLAVDLARELAPVANQPYIVFHDAYQYFEKRFNLAVVGSITINPEIPPSGKRLAGLRAKIAKVGAACVFSEPNFDAKVIATIAEGTPARTGVLDPEGAALTAGPDLYDTLMRNLAGSLKACLQPSG